MHRIMGYYWFIDFRGPNGEKRVSPPLSPVPPPKEWVTSVVATKAAPALVELIADVTASDGPDRDRADFSKATGGCWGRWQVYDRSNHLRKGTRPVGGNILFVDGHVQWRKFDDMERRWFPNPGNPSFWW